MKKPTVEQHLRSELAKARAQVKDLQARNDNQNAQLQNMLNIEQQLNSELKALQEDLGNTRSKLADKTQAYAFRHNQDMETTAKLRAVQAELRGEQFQHQALKAEMTRLLVLTTFPGGQADELMITRSRNRLRACLTPEPKSEEQASDMMAEGAPNLKLLEDTTK